MNQTYKTLTGVNAFLANKFFIVGLFNLKFTSSKFQLKLNSLIHQKMIFGNMVMNSDDYSITCKMLSSISVNSIILSSLLSNNADVA